jgi:PAS domain S-box-containing protein
MSQVPSCPRLVLNALLVGVACYFGSQLDSALHFPRIGIPILIPLYALLTAALLLSPAQQWWIYVLPASIGALIPHLDGWPASWSLGAEAANVLPALIAAGGIGYLGRGTRHFHTLRGVGVFLLAAVLLAPLLAAFIGAGVVTLHRGAADFWLLWQGWFFSTALTALILLPILLLGITTRDARLGGVPARRFVEAGLLLAGLLTVGIVSFVLPPGASSHPPARLYAPLPFLLWAAVRFGPGGASAALLIMAALVIWGALHGRGPFNTQSPADDMLSLQLFLITASVPVLVLAGVVQERAQAAEALRESEERYRAVVNSQQELICRYLPDTTLTFVNDAYCRFFGKTSDELIGASFLSLIPAPAREAARLHVASLKSDPRLVRYEHEVVLPDGRVGWQEWSDHALLDADGKLIGFQGVGQDTTEQKRAAEALRHARAELARANRAMTVGELAASIAHEVNQPLGAVVANATFCRQLLAAPTPDLGEVREVIEEIVQDGIRADEVIRRVRSLLRSGPAQRETLDLHGLIREVIALMQSEARARRVSLEIELAARPVLVVGDRVQLQQVVLNLLVNALDAMNDNGEQARTLRVASRTTEPGWVEVTVHDTGVGLGEKELEQIFEPFYTTKAEGMGMGLSITQRIVEGHGGRIWATANPDRGATFHFMLPAKSAA